MPILTPKPFFTGRLASGIEIDATSVYMNMTYAGVLEGLPNNRANTRLLDGLPEQYEKFWTTEPVPVHVIPSEVERPEFPGFDDDAPPRIVAMLPPIEIAAFFNSHTVKKPNNEGSHLILVWHQHEAVPFMSPAVWAQVEQIDWPALAKDWETW